MLVKSTGLTAREAQVLRADAAWTEALKTPPHCPVGLPLPELEGSPGGVGSTSASLPI